MRKTFVIICSLIFSTMASLAQTDDIIGNFCFSFGGSYHAPRTDYVSQFGGVDAGFSCTMNSGNFYMFDVAVGGGKAQKDFSSHDGKIYKGDKLTTAQIFLDYGRVVRQTERTQLIPFGGIGMTGYTYTFPHDYDEDPETIDKTAFGVNVGLCYDIRLGRSTEIYQGIRVKPLATVSFYGSPLNVVPSFNLAICYCIGFY